MALVTISISQLLTGSSKLTRIYLALVNLPITKSACIARVAPASEVINTIHTDSVEAVVAGTVIIVPLTPAAREATWAVTGEGVERVMADSTIVARVGGTVVNVDLAVCATKPINTSAMVGVDAVSTNPIVSARIGRTLINIVLAIFSSVSWHTNASELSSTINTGPLIQTRVAVTFVYVDLTSRTSVSLRTSALVRPWSVHTNSFVFTGSGNPSTLVNILFTCGACVPRRTGAGSLPCHGVCVTSCSWVARVP